jgi:hypothetical protein
MYGGREIRNFGTAGDREAGGEEETGRYVEEGQGWARSGNFPERES